MVASKTAKTNSSLARKNVATRNFKVFTETEKLQVEAETKKPVVGFRRDYTLTSSNASKGALKSMENFKGKSVSSVMNIGRKPLADVSNVARQGSKYMKGKIESSTSSQRVSVGPTARTTNVSSRKPLMGKVRDSQGVGESHTFSRGVTHNLKASLEDQGSKAKPLSHESTTTSYRKTVRKPPILTRKSLPVLRRTSKAETSTAKEIAESSQEVKEKVVAKVGKKVIPTVRRSTLWRNRASDGFIIMGQTRMDDSTSSGKSIKPIVKTKLRGSISQRIPKSKGTSNLKKSVSVAKISPENKDEAVTTLPEKVISLPPHEAAQGDLPSNGSCNQSSSATIAKRKSDRRRSYTSLLIAGSKLLDRYSEVKEEKLPSIDDGSNQLEVAEYVDEIYRYYWVMEAQNPSMENYMSIQTDITPQMRGILVNWLIEVHFKFDLMKETLYLMITLLDMYLSQVPIKKNELQLVGLTALLLASKYEDFWHPRVKELISIAVESYTREQMLGMERLILKKLKFRLNSPTPYVFMLRFLKAAHSDTKLEHLAFYLIELCLIKYEALKYKPSLLCASALYVARCTLQLSPAWTPLLGKHTRYEVSQIRNCAEMILKFQKAARTGPLHVTFEKYMRRDFSSVAAIKPLDKLPQ